MKMNQDDWEDMLLSHIAAFETAAAPEQSEFNSVGISLHTAERWAKKHSWKFELRPVYIGGGVYLRVFNFTPLDQSIKRIDGEEKKGGKNDYL